MKSHVLAVALAFAIVAIPSAALANDSIDCTAETISGSYGIQVTGFSDFVAGPNPSRIGDYAPITAVGRTELLPDGTIAGSEVGNVGGVVFPFTSTGMYEVSSDCTGTLTRNLSIGGTEVFHFVVVQDGNKILLMNKSPSTRLFWGQMERLSDRKKLRAQ